jgi:hypothetical protein
VLNGGGYGGALDYDASVYYAAADALVHGRLPYRDFVLVHPPVVALVLAPFAALGRFAGDHTGFVLACLAMVMIGAANALLVTRLARRLGASPVAAFLGGAWYAVWPGATASEYACRLEPIGNLFVLLALLRCLRGADGAAARRGNLVLGGVAAALAVSTKIWWAVAALVFAVFVGVRARAQARWYLAGMLAAIAVVDVPFFVAAPRAMLRMIFLDQVSRGQNHPLDYRLGYLSGISHLVPHPGHGLVLGAAVITTVAVVALGVAAVMCRGAGWLIGALLLAELVVILVAPSYFVTYDDFLAPASALALALVARHLRRSRSAVWLPRGAGHVAVALLATAVVVAATVRTPQLAVRYPGRALAKGLSSARCVASDSPMALIMLDALSRDLARGCPVEVDLAGRRIDRERAAAAVPMVNDMAWQAYLSGYLLGQDAVAIYPASLARFGPRLRTALRSLPVLAAAGGFLVRRT